MNKRLSEIQKEAYERALDGSMGLIEISVDVDQYSDVTLKKNRKKIIEELDYICQGKDSCETLDKLISEDYAQKIKELEEETDWDAHSRVRSKRDSVAFFAKPIFENLYYDNRKDKIVQDKPYEPFVKLMRDHMQREEENKIREMKDELHFLETGEKWYLGHLNDEYFIKEE